MLSGQLHSNRGFLIWLSYFFKETPFLHNYTDSTFERSFYRVHKYDNLSSLCDDIGRIFEKAGKNISKMSEQFYAVNNQKINDLLKSYFPEHFKDKKFLAYPIGQFILALYKMWDHQKQQLVFHEEHLKECLMIPLVKKEGKRTLLDIFLRISPFLQGAKYEQDVFERIRGC